MRDDPERILDILEAIERIEKVAVRGRGYSRKPDKNLVFSNIRFTHQGEADLRRVRRTLRWGLNAPNPKIDQFPTLVSLRLVKDVAFNTILLQ